MKEEANELIKHGGIQLIDYAKSNGYKCKCCNNESSYTLHIGDTQIPLCYECIGDLGHCVIDGLL